MIQVSGSSDPAAWRAAVDAHPTDPSMRLGLARTLVSQSAKVTCAGGDGAELLAECAFTLCGIGDLEGLTDGEAMLFAGTAAGCASGLLSAGRPRLALGVLTPAAHLLDARSDLAGTITPQAKPALPGADPAAEVDRAARAKALVEEARTDESNRRFPNYAPRNPEDVAPGEVFETPWPLPPVSWHYLRASIGVAMGCSRAAVGEKDKALEDLSEAMLVAFAGAPYDYARTVSLSATIGRRMEQIMRTGKPQGRPASR
ncbi:hypothetical protein [Demequina zhanjiangensis]|uniref:Uncharacterized protein n=1 Tax=Demequina zhanjiangensis TaxID=3051659 RepID=A0ABT8G2U7_9MICO|nr:hypothetical protein [Demequina sp. SYSU T00b26]MDN4473477.1 hypothetical protein [Demequina sp. SYSU T00b26]